jgi:hypothetical protein
MLKPALKPYLQPVVDAIDAYLSEKTLNPVQMAEMIYGRDANGEVRNSNFNPTMRGRYLPTQPTIELIKDKTGLDLTEAVQKAKAQHKELSHSARGRPKKAPAKPALTPVKAALEAYHNAASKPPQPGASVALTVTSPDGGVHISLVDVSLELAAQVLQALVAAGRR